MQKYRRLDTVDAVQYTGEPLEGITCEGTEDQRKVGGCDNTRAHFPHAHTRAIGGLTVLKAGDWILPVSGGPFTVFSDADFRARFEVPVVAVAAAQPVEAPVEVTPEPALPEPAKPFGFRTMFGLGQAPAVQPPIVTMEPMVAGDADLEHAE